MSLSRRQVMVFAASGIAALASACTGTPAAPTTAPTSPPAATVAPTAAPTSAPTTAPTTAPTKPAAAPTAAPTVAATAATKPAATAAATTAPAKPATTTTPAATGWTFKDDRGIEVSAPTRPTRVVAYAAPGAALWHLGVKPLGIFGGYPLDQNPNLTDIDLAGIESVGTVYGEVSIEKLLALRADLIVTAFSPIQGELTWGFKDLALQNQIQGIAPIVAINGIKDPTEVIARFEELAVALGANLQRDQNVAARQHFDRAIADLKAAVATKPGLTAVAVTASNTDVRFAKPSAFPALRQVKSWGLNIIEPTGGTDFWEPISLEQINKYTPDLFLVSRTGIQALSANALWQALPVVRAGHVALWDHLENWSHERYARDIDEITGGVKKTDPNLVP